MYILMYDLSIYLSIYCAIFKIKEPYLRSRKTMHAK